MGEKAVKRRGRDYLSGILSAVADNRADYRKHRNRDRHRMRWHWSHLRPHYVVECVLRGRPMR